MEDQLDLNDKRFEVDGLYWWDETKPNLWRLPPRYEGKVPDAVWFLSKMSTGARLRFTTDARTFRLMVNWPLLDKLREVGRLSAAAIEIWIDGEFWMVRGPKAETPLTLTWFDGLPPQPREICVYFPDYTQVELQSISFTKGAAILPPKLFSHPKPIVFYGTSLAQGAYASRPSMNWPAQIGRALNYDYVNLGFAGAGKGEPILAEVMAEIDAALYVVELGYNTISARKFEEMYPAFINKLIELRPDIPILCVSATFSTIEVFGDPKRLARMRTITQEVVEAAAKTGANMQYINGSSLLSPNDRDGLADNMHPNDLGMTYIASRLIPTVKRMVELGL